MPSMVEGEWESDGGHFLTAKADDRLALMGYWYSCFPVGLGYVDQHYKPDNC